MPDVIQGGNGGAPWRTAAEVALGQGYNLGLFAYPGAGKTILAASAPRPLILDVDLTASKSLTDRPDVQLISGYTTWDEWKQRSDWLLDRVGTPALPFDTFSWDTVTSLHNLAALKEAGPGRSPDIQQWGRANTMVDEVIKDWVDAANTKGINVIFACHVVEERDGETGPLLIRLALTPGSRTNLYRRVDTIGYLEVHPLSQKRKLILKSTGKTIGKHHQPMTAEMRIPLEIEEPNLSKIFRAMKWAAEQSAQKEK